MRSGFSSSTATARPAGRPAPDSRQVVPASCETTSGGFRSTTATTVDPTAAAASTSGSPTSTRCGSGGSPSSGATSSVSRSTAKEPRAVRTEAVTALRSERSHEMQIVNDLSERAFRRHYADVYRYVRRRGHSHHDAEDLAQQVFADAAASLRADGRPPLAW